MNKKSIIIILTNEIELIPTIYRNKKTKSLNLHFLFIKLITKGI